jgi:hypothetical protein
MYHSWGTTGDPESLGGVHSANHPSKRAILHPAIERKAELPAFGHLGTVALVVPNRVYHLEPRRVDITVHLDKNHERPGNYSRTMALPLPPGLVPTEVAFLCEMEMVTIVPRQRLESIPLLSVSQPRHPTTEPARMASH